MYKVKIEKFEGPLDLLLELIEKEKLDITEISLAKVTEQYVQYIEDSTDIDPSNLADFLVVAAKLILIKSRAILPDLDIDEEDEESIEDLKRRLIEYKRFKEAAKKLKEMYHGKHRSFAREKTESLKKVFYPGQNLSIINIEQSARNLVKMLSKFEKLKQETISETISIKEKIAYLQEKISKKVNFKFEEVIKKSKTRLDAIVSFLALLELVKQRIISASQKENFGEIDIQQFPGA